MAVRRRPRPGIPPAWYPLAFFQVYLFGSLVAYAIGPVERDTPRPLLLYGYLLAGQLAIFLGYKFGLATRPTAYAWSTSPRQLIRVSLLSMLAILPVTLTWRSYGDLSILEAVKNPGVAYAARVQSLAYGDSSTVLSLVRGVLAPLLQLFLPLGIVYWKTLTKPVKMLWLVGVLGMVVQALITGAAVGVFDVVLALPWLLWLAFSMSRSQPHADQQHRRTTHLRRASPLKRWATMGLAAVALAAGIQYFSYSRQARYGLASNEYLTWTIDWSQEMYGVPLPNAIEYPIYMLTDYWTHGYEGLSHCMELPFEGCYGIGHSAVMMRYAGMLTNDPDYFWDRCYPARLEADTGYSATGRWHSIYPWLASDLTWFGAIVALGVLAALMAQSWRDAIGGRNPLAIAFFVQTLMIFYYVPANNGRLSFSEEMIAFWTLLVLWKLSRRRLLPSRQPVGRPA